MEGPSIVILKSEAVSFKGKRIRKVSGNSSVDQRRLAGQSIKDFKSWGKHFLIIFNGFYLRVHFLMFGSYRINERKHTSPRLSLQFDDDSEFNFYSCAISETDGNPKQVYDWSIDVMSRQWDAAKARRKLKRLPDITVSDALLDQQIFAGVGNIIKNEVLFRIKVHPETLIGNLPPRLLTLLVTEARNYSFDFLHWKKIYQLKKHWLIFTKKKCPDCKRTVVKKYTGKTRRRSFFCPHCQVRY
jgi:endonuclease VIII